MENKLWDVIIVGAGCAGLSAAIYLARAMRETLVVDAGRSMALLEPDVQNYLGFPDGISGSELLVSGRTQAEKYGATFVDDEIAGAYQKKRLFYLEGKKGLYRARRVLLATGAFHIPPDIPEVSPCLGRSMFFCKDCDGFRNQGKKIAIVGQGNEAVDYALGMFCYASCVFIATNGQKPTWDAQHAEWINEYEIPIYDRPIAKVCHENGFLRSLTFSDGTCAAVDGLFTTRGDIFHNKLARKFGVKLDEDGQIRVDRCMRTSVRGIYAAGCVTPANCQMIIAAGQGATASQAINRDLFEESLKTHRLQWTRARQIASEQTEPVELVS